MTSPFTPDERAAMRERAERLHHYGGESQEASEDIRRLLDALDTAEAERDAERSKARRAEVYLRMEREAARRNLERAERAEAEVARGVKDYEDNLAAQVLAARHGREKAWAKARRRKAERDDALAEVARLRETAARAWDEGFSASDRAWEETFDLTTPDEERTDPRNPYRMGLRSP